MDEGHLIMRTNHKRFGRAAFALALSMSATPNLVNAQAQSLTTVNKDNSSKPELKDSDKESRTDIEQLISTVLKKGTSENIRGNLALIIGLPKAMPVIDVAVDISQKADIKETRSCFVVYEDVENLEAAGDGKRALYAYTVRKKRAGLTSEARYFRLDLNGNLEKVVYSKWKYDETGKVVKGSGVKTDLDITSPEVRKAFDAEMNFWLNDWLKKEQTNAAKPADAPAKTPSAPSSSR